MRRIFVVAVVHLLLASTAFGVTILGQMTCGDWVQDRKTGKASRMEFWVLGFLSGSAVQTDLNVLKGQNANSIETWIDNYCSKNPLDRLPKAVDKLFEELSRRE